MKRVAPQKGGGFTLIAVLLAVALFSAALGAAGTVWRTTVQRAKEADLMFIGEEFKRAVTSYYESTPGAVKQLPKTLDDLLTDRRYPTIRRHLRRIYIDPMTGKADWVLLTLPGGILGVRSRSDAEPFRKLNVPSSGSTERYSDWRFAAELVVVAAPAVSGTAVRPPVMRPAAAPPGRR